MAKRSGGKDSNEAAWLVEIVALAARSTNTRKRTSRGPMKGGGSGVIVRWETSHSSAAGRTVTSTMIETLRAPKKTAAIRMVLLVADGNSVLEPRYVRRPCRPEPRLGGTSVHYDLGDLLVGSAARG